MLALKYSYQLSWGELRYIKDPMHAICTVELEHGKHIQNAHLHDLSDEDDRRFDPYRFIKTKLENGQVFLINHSTVAPAIQSLELDADGKSEYTFRNSTNPFFIFQPDFDLEEKDSDLEVTCLLNGIVSDQAKFEFQLWVREPRPEGYMGHYYGKPIKLEMPDEIIQLSGQAYKLIWKDFPVDKHSRYKIKYKIELYGNDEIKIPGRYDEDGWIEQWL